MLLSGYGWAECDPAGGGLFGDALPSAYLAGRPTSDFDDPERVTLQFWASWCQSCSGVTRDLAGLVKQAPSVRHLAISTDENVDAARKVAVRLSAAADGNVSVLHDSEGAWAQRYRVVSVPTVIVLDGAGVELGRFVGHLNSSDLARIAHLLDDAVDSKATEAKE